jgi:hypothetical protein
MGYSMRTLDYRYTAWLHFNRTGMIPYFDLQPFTEELYDHRREIPEDFTHLELVNLAKDTRYEDARYSLYLKLITYLKNNIVYRGPYID